MVSHEVELCSCLSTAFSARVSPMMAPDTDTRTDKQRNVVIAIIEEEQLKSKALENKNLVAHALYVQGYITFLVCFNRTFENTPNLATSGDIDSLEGALQFSATKMPHVSTPFTHNTTFYNDNLHDSQTTSISSSFSVVSCGDSISLCSSTISGLCTLTNRSSSSHSSSSCAMDSAVAPANGDILDNGF